jgi:hypothetical protein
MASRYIDIAVPEGWRLYVFGSYLTRPEPRDLDILGIYDRARVDPSRAYSSIRDVIALEAVAGVPVQLTLLSIQEAEEIRFVETEECIPLSSVATGGRHRPGAVERG